MIWLTSKSLSPHQAGAMVSEPQPVPKGWTLKTLGELGRYLNGRAFKKSEWSKTGRPIIRIQDLTGSNRNPNHFDGELPDRYIVRPGDLLISWSATLGAYLWDGPEGVLNQHIFKVESDIDRTFHYHLVRHSLGQLQRSAHGSGMVHVTKGAFENTPVVIPESRDLQRKIAGAINRADRIRGSAVHHLRVARRTIERYRGAVIAAACVGALTADWRRDHPDIHSTADRLAFLQTRNHQKKARASQPPEIPIPDVPDTYLITDVGSVADAIEYGTSQKASSVSEGGVPVLRMGNIQDGRIDLTELKYLTRDKEVEKLQLVDGDLLFNRTNSPELVGKSAVFHGEDVMTYASYIIRVQFDRDLAVADYVNYWVNSAWGRLWASHVKTDGVSQSNINGTKLASMPLPLPPLDEQVEIVRRVSEMLRRIEKLAELLDAATRSLGQSEQAVLKKAFRGELVTAKGRL